MVDISGCRSSQKIKMPGLWGHLASLVLLATYTTAVRSAGLPFIAGSISTLFNTSEEVWEPRGLAKSLYAADGSDAYIVIDSSAIVKMSKDPSDSEYKITQLAGHPVITGYEDGDALTARFSHISDFAQSADGRKVYITDQNNHCIRLFDRLGNNVTVFAGNCTEIGAHTGPVTTARFSRPAGIIMSQDWSELFVADRQNNRVLRVDLLSEIPWVRTIVDNSFKVGLQVILPTALAQSADRTKLYVTTDDGLVMFTNYSNIQNHSPVKTVVSKVVVSGLLDIILTHNDQYAITTDLNGARLIFLDLVNGGTAQFCTGMLSHPMGSVDGPSDSCELNSPQGLTAIDDSNLFVAEHYSRLMRKVTYQIRDLTTTTTEPLPTTPPISTASAATEKETSSTKTTIGPTLNFRGSLNTKVLGTTEKPKKTGGSPLILGLSVGITVPLLLLGILVTFISYIRIQANKHEHKLMYARRCQQGGYRGPGGYDDQTFQTALQRSYVSTAPPPIYSSTERLPEVMLNLDERNVGSSRAFRPTTPSSTL